MSHTLLTKREATQRARVSERTHDRILASGDGPTMTPLADPARLERATFAFGGRFLGFVRGCPSLPFVS